MISDAELQTQLMLWKGKTNHYAKFVREIIEELIERRKPPKLTGKSFR